MIAKVHVSGIINRWNYLKGLRHEDFAILGHFCAKLITECLYSHTKCSCKTMRKMSNEFYQGELTIIMSIKTFTPAGLEC